MDGRGGTELVPSDEWFETVPSQGLFSRLNRLKVRYVAWDRCLIISSATQSHPAVCDTLDCSMPGLPVHHQLPELAQTHVHRVGDATQPSHPLLSSPPAFDLSQHQGLFYEWALCIRWPKYWSFRFSPSSEYSGLISFKIGIE